MSTPPPSDLDDLFRAALAARERAYAPYSGYRVGAALRDEAGRLSVGCNVENAAYPVGTCAEAGAIAAMVAAGGTRIADIVVVAQGPELVAPCGACRQRIFEFSEPGTRIHLGDLARIGQTSGIDALLPGAFGPRNLGRPS